MISRDEALGLIKRYVKKENNIKHMIAVGAVMKETAMKLGEDQERWELAGILHDIDFEQCSGLSDHTKIAKDLLKGIVDDDLIDVIMAHNYENTGIAPDTKIKKGLIASDAVSGLVIASALVMPSKKLSEVTPESLAKKFKSKDFAKGANRTKIALCSELGMSNEDFMATALAGMKKVAAELGL
jgi:putative nucleotidyltransferase with HDIG domain